MANNIEHYPPLAGGNGGMWNPPDKSFQREIVGLLIEVGFAKEHYNIMADKALRSSNLDWVAFTIKYLKKHNAFNEALFKKESDNIDWDKKTVAYDDIKEYVNSLPQNQKTETINTPVNPAPEPVALSTDSLTDKQTLEIPKDVYHNLGTVKNDYGKYKDCLKTEKQKIYFSLWYEYGCTKMEIARRMKVKHQTVLDALNRATTNVIKEHPEFKSIAKSYPV